MAGELLYVQEHTSCRHYISDFRSAFRFLDLEPGVEQRVENEPVNCVDFVLEGEALISCNDFLNKPISAGRMAFFPKGSVFKCKAVTKCTIIRFVFDTLSNVCDKMSLRSYWPICAKTEYDFRQLEIKPEINMFLDALNYLLRKGVNCEHFHELKKQEVFLIFRWFYSKEDLAAFFYPIIGKSLDFKALVLENYLKVANVSELAELSNMGRSHFDFYFKEEFGMPARQWMLKQMANHIKYHLSEPGVTLSDVMNKFNFNSPTHFTRFCKQQFGCTPTELMTKLQTL